MNLKKASTIAVFVVLFSTVLYVVGYLAVAHSEAVETARNFAAKNEYFDQGKTPRVGITGFMIKVSGGSGSASFNLVVEKGGMSRTVYFDMEM